MDCKCDWESWEWSNKRRIVRWTNLTLKWSGIGWILQSWYSAKACWRSWLRSLEEKWQERLKKGILAVGIAGLWTDACSKLVTTPSSSTKTRFSKLGLVKLKCWWNNVVMSIGQIGWSTDEDIGTKWGVGMRLVGWGWLTVVEVRCAVSWSKRGSAGQIMRVLLIVIGESGIGERKEVKRLRTLTTWLIIIGWNSSGITTSRRIQLGTNPRFHPKFLSPSSAFYYYNLDVFWIDSLLGSPHQTLILSCHLHPYLFSPTFPNSLCYQISIPSPHITHSSFLPPVYPSLYPNVE